MNKTPKAIVLLYVLLGYVVAQFAWWAYLIYDLNGELIKTNELLGQLQGVDSFGAEKELRSKLFMILGEGSVFLGLLILGAFYIRKFVLREQRLAKQERNFLLATTHEFNSPIAAIKLNLQTLIKRTMPADQQRKVVDSALSANHRLELLVSNILMASRLDAGKFELLREELKLKHVFQSVIERYAGLAESAGNTFYLEVEEELSASIDRSTMEILMGNLIENAIKYAPGGNIVIAAQQNQSTLTISVTDEGQGIARDEKANVFKKFYRSENEETRTQKGSGLGLYLVKQICDLHGAQITLSDNTPRGAKINMKFKR